MRPLLLCLLLCRVSALAQEEPPLLTVAESSDYKATAKYLDVIAFLDELGKRSRIVRRATLATTAEGRAIPLVILADPPLGRPADAKKPVAFVLGNIHAGEVCGKEALLMLAREIATARKHPLLKELVLVFLPIYNADGNERFKKDNRPGQVGPADGMGQRPNAAGLDLNREYTKIESPEARGLMRFYRRWKPVVVIDTHTTNGSRHGYTLTYAGPRSLAGDPKVVEFVRDTMMPEVSARMEKATGFKSFFYGNFDREKTEWRMYPALPRYGTVYNGLRNRIAILSEAYAYASYKDRVLVTKAFVEQCLRYAAENRKTIVGLVRKAKPAAEIAIRSRAAVLGEKIPVVGDGETHEVSFFGRQEPVLTVKRPFAYVLPASFASGKVVENLLRHGLVVEEFREDIELEVEVYRIDKVRRAPRAFQKHQLVAVEATARRESRRIEAGSILVRATEALAVYLLEPQSDDGLLTWNFFDEGLAEGADFPVLRLPAAVSITRRRVRPLEEDRKRGRRVTFKHQPRLGGSAVRGLSWLDDGEHFLQRKDGKLLKVHALSGRAEPYRDSKSMEAALAALPTIDKAAARRLARRPTWGPKRKGAIVTHENDLYYWRADGSKAVRLTRTPERESALRFSPDGAFVAFVRDYDLLVVDVATQTERALTTGGDENVRNGILDWVYDEEIYGRGRKVAYWWSPDGSYLAFLQIDDRPVHRFTVLDQIPVRQDVTAFHYPKAGDPNPRARLGFVSAAGGTVRWADLGGYLEGSFLITRVGWKPDGKTAWFFVQDRAQTWLDFMTVRPRGGKPKRLFRETTGAWVSARSVPHWLEDGTFLFPSERTGWRHLYHYDKNGTLVRAVTKGEFEVRSLDVVGEWLYFSGTKDSHTQSHLYRTRLDGTGLERLTRPGGSHRTSLDPKGKYFIDTWSDPSTPARVALFRAGTGEMARMLDTNPVHELEEYELGAFERVQIETKDGFLLEASVLRPPDFDPKRKYPVWFMTYAGPHAPTIRDSYRRSSFDEMLANWGIVVFRADPRPASGKGAVSAWTAYRQLGVQEMKDIAEAIGWLKRKPWIDGARIGMSGHSYGGFMTSYALTHSKLFRAGIAGAPVTDWRNYDTIYTERYMDTPQANPGGYAKTSVVRAASNLHGRLLLVHGVRDDNVHVANTLQLADALQRAGKQFEIMVYPRNRHGIGGNHYRKLRADFIRRTLLAPR